MSDQGTLFGDDGQPSEAAVAAAPAAAAAADRAVLAAPDRDLTVGPAEPGPGRDPASVLAPWRAAGVLTVADVHIATTLARLAGLGTAAASGAAALDDDEALVVLGAALAARAPRMGHVCLDLTTVRASVPAEVEGDADTMALEALDALPWPATDRWRAALAASPLVLTAADGVVAPPGPGRARPLVLDGDLLYLERYRVYEDRVAAELLRRAERSAVAAAAIGGAAPSVARSAFAGVFPASEEQQAAAEAGAAGLVSVLVGGPGTGKTTTVATLLALLLEADPATRIALVAPTGKAAARMGESIDALAATLRASGVPGADGLAERLAGAEVSTIHRRLVWRPDGTFRHRRDEPLVHDVVIVDETSMVSLPLMAHLLDAVRPDARVVLVGDPGQLASVEAGSVLGDIAGPAVDAALTGGPAPAGPLSRCVAVLTRSYRFPEGSAVGHFAAAVRRGDADAALAVLSGAATDPAGEGGDPADADADADGAVRMVWAAHGADTEPGAEAVRAAALDGARLALDAAAAGDPDGALAALGRVRVLCAHRRGPFGVAWWNWCFEGWLADDDARLAGNYPGRPVMVTANDPLNGVANGDLGVIVATDEGARLALPVPGGVRLLSPARLEAIDTVHAMTIHKSQGSEFDEVVVVLPPPNSRLATRELLYTAVTRARRVVTLVGGAEAVRRSVANRVVRQTGLRRRLWPTEG